jgi:UDP-glucose 4-epimerase
MVKKVLVTGGAGFIGSQIVDGLIARGGEVGIIDNFSSGKKENLNFKAKLFEGDIVEKGFIERVFEKIKPEIVIHTAAQVMLRKSLEEPIKDAMINIIGTLNLLEACRKFGVRKIVYTSTGGARVGEPEYLPVDEKHPLKPCSPYGISKHSAEHYVWMYNQLYGLDYCIYCFGNVYGPRDVIESGRLIPVFIDKMLRGEKPKIFGDGSQTRDFIYVGDLVTLVVDILEKTTESKLFHLASGKQTSVNEVFMNLKEILGFNGDAENVEAVKGEVKDIVLDIKLAQRELGWSPEFDLKEGLKKSVEWFKNKRKLF